MADSKIPLAAALPFRGHLPQLDGLRAIAISGVLLHHFWPTSGVPPQLASVVHLGWIGVDLFFVISGFLICGILLDSREAEGYFRNFYARRSLRIFPLYYVFLAVMATAIPLIQRSTEFFDQSGSILWYVLYAGNIREMIVGHEPAYVMAPLWSLSIEEQFYISFPLIVWWLGPRRLWKLLWVLVLMAPVCRLVAFLLWPGNERIQYLSPLSRMDTLAIGCLIATAFRLGKIKISVKTINALAAIAVLTMGTVFLLGGLNRLHPFCRIAGYSISAFAFGVILIWSILTRPSYLAWLPLTALGKISYGVYLLQRPTEVLLGKLLQRLNINIDPVLQLLMNIAASILIAAISWNFFEKHILKLKDRFVVRKLPAVEVGISG